MIKLVLVAALSFCAIYGWRQRRLSLFVGILLPFVCLAGVLLVLRPELSTEAANFLGVGRGVDLILYLWVAVSLLLLANIHFRLRAQHAMISVLTREVAILEADPDRK